MFQILTMLDQIRELRLPWIPFSLHHDGCALLVELSTFEESKNKLVESLKEKLAPSGMQIKGLEFTRYKSDIVFAPSGPEALQKEGRII